MANNTQIVRKSLLKSSISLQTINKSVTFLSKDLKRATNLLQNTGKVQEQDNRFKRALLGRENTWFNRRREQVLRREKEDITEAATVGGAIKRRGKVVGSSTKGFLGRILDVFGILFIGWLTTNLPPILRAVNNMIKLIQKTVSILSGFINNTVGFFNSLGAGLDNVLGNLTVGFRFDKDTESIKKGFDDMNRGTRMFSADIESSIGTYLDPKTYGRDNWDLPTDETEINKPEGTARNFGGLVDFATFGMTDLDKRGNLFGGRHGRTGFSNIDGASNDEQIEEQQKTDTVKVEPKDTLVKGANEDKKDREIDNDSAIANNPDANLETRFENGFIPPKRINGVDNPQYIEYKEWLNGPGGLDMFKYGGFISGKPHSQGGENINVEGGEAVIPKKRVEQYGPEYINAIIQGNADNVTKLRAGRSALDKAVEDFKEANDGIIKYDEYKRIEAETYGRVKAHLNSKTQGTTSDQVAPKQQSEPKIEIPKSKVNQMSSGPMKRKRKVVQIPIPNNNQQQQVPMSPPSGRKMNSGKPRSNSGGLHIGDLQSLMLAYT